MFGDSSLSFHSDLHEILTLTTRPIWTEAFINLSELYDETDFLQLG